MMRFLIVVCTALLVAITPVQAAQLKGINTLSRELSARIAPPEAPLDLDLFMPADGLDDLTGTWVSFGSEHSFQNGQPNAVNMVLLRLTFSRFAGSLAESCKSPQIILNEAFSKILETICAWPSAKAQSEEAMMAVWLALIGYEAPHPEYEAWRNFIRASYAEEAASDAIEAMVLTAMLNPYFLLQR